MDLLGKLENVFLVKNVWSDELSNFTFVKEWVSVFKVDWAVSFKKFYSIYSMFKLNELLKNCKILQIKMTI